MIQDVITGEISLKKAPKTLLEVILFETKIFQCKKDEENIPPDSHSQFELFKFCVWANTEEANWHAEDEGS